MRTNPRSLLEESTSDYCYYRDLLGKSFLARDLLLKRPAMTGPQFRELLKIYYPRGKTYHEVKIFLQPLHTLQKNRLVKHEKNRVSASLAERVMTTS